MFTQDRIETDNTKMFIELFSKLRLCNEEEQKQKILEMRGVMDYMNENEFTSVFSIGILNRMKMFIEDRKLSIENTILLLKHIGYCKELKDILNGEFFHSKLKYFIRNMIIDENEKKEEKNEKLLVDLCECYLLLDPGVSLELLSTCVPILLKWALNKMENKESRKDVEMALLALSSYQYCHIEQELNLNEIKEIIKYHQEHRNLTHLAYQSIWRYLIDRLEKDKSLERVFVNELHFVREAASELEDLIKCVDWKKKKEMSEKEAREVHIIRRWIRTLRHFFEYFRLWNEELAGLISSIAQLFRAARENKREISWQCINLLKAAEKRRDTKINFFLKGGAVDAFLEEIQQSTIDKRMECEILNFFSRISRKLEKKIKDEQENEKRKATKRKVFEKLEEEGYEDTVVSFHGTFDFLQEENFFQLWLEISDSL